MSKTQKTNLQNWRSLYGPGRQPSITELGFISFGKHSKKKEPLLLTESAGEGNRRYLGYGQPMLGPWEKAKKILSLSRDILNKEIVTTQRLTPEECKDKIRKLGGNYSVTERGSKTETQTTQKAKVISLDKERRHAFEAKDNLLIQIDEECWDKIQCWIHMTDKEISGLGCVRHLKDGIFSVYDVFLFEQENTSNFTDIDDIAVQKLMIELDTMDEEDSGTRFKDMRFWWHSHVDMDVKWSTQDDNNIEKKLFGDASEEGKVVCPWWVSAVVNKKGSVNTRVDIADPWLTLERVSYRIKHHPSPDIAEFCKTEYQKKVREKTYTYNSSTNYNESDEYWKDWRTRFNKEDKTESPGGSHKTQAETNTTGATPSISRFSEEDKSTYALIPTPKETNMVQNQTVAGAYKLWEKEIIDGLTFLYNVMLEHKITGIKTSGLAFRPIRIPGSSKISVYDTEVKRMVTIDTQYEWTFSGSIRHNDYMLTVWPESNIMHLGRIHRISATDKDDARSYLQAKAVRGDKFTKIGIGVEPGWEYTDKRDEKVVAIIFSSVSAIPNDVMGDIFPSIDDLITKTDSDDGWDTEADDWEDNWGLPGLNKKDKEKEDEEKEEQETQSDDDTLETEEGDLYDDVEAYADVCHKSDILHRIQDWTKNMDKDLLVDVVEVVTDAFGDTFPEACVQALTAQSMTEDELREMISLLAAKEPSMVFAEIFQIIPHKGFCPECYEPLRDTVDQCPECETHLKWN